MSLPQRSLYGGLLVTSLVVTTALVWSGWRLVAQQRELDARQARLDAEASADALTADIRDALAEQGDRLSARLGVTGGSAAPPTEGVIVTVRVTGAGVAVSGMLPFLPWSSPASAGRPVLDETFGETEVAEFGARTADMALTRYRTLARHSDAGIRAGALFRLARMLRKRGDTAGATTAADALVTLGHQDVDGIPAALAGFDTRRLALTERGDAEGARRAAEEMRDRLDRGEWALDRGTAEFYRDAVSEAPRPDAWLLASALHDAWEARGGPALPPRGMVVFAPAGRTVIVAWRANPVTAALEAVFADRFLSSVARNGVQWHLTDAEDRLVAGVTDARPPDTDDRVIGGGTSWTLRAWSAPGAVAPDGQREAMLMAATAGTVLFVWAGAAIMMRALTREAKVAQLQSDFVAAVSHEFRSPLTTMRQMAEMLETDRVPDEARRRQYYRVLTGETTRLQRLVERLLDFGRMEAGQDAKQHERLESALVVDDVVSGLTDLSAERHACIAVSPAAHRLYVRGDAQALGLAVRNIIENAVKYSPDHSKVTVRLGQEGARAHVTSSAVRILARDVVSGAERVLVSQARPHGAAPSVLEGLSLSPDGTWIATSTKVSATGEATLCAVSVATGESRELLGASKATTQVLMWAPDSRSLFVRRSAAAGKREVLRIPIAGTEPTVVTWPFGDQTHDFRVHPDGRRLVFVETPPDGSRGRVELRALAGLAR